MKRFNKIVEKAIKDADSKDEKLELSKFRVIINGLASGATLKVPEDVQKDLQKQLFEDWKVPKKVLKNILSL